jgi:hypothetical protein
VHVSRRKTHFGKCFAPSWQATSVSANGAENKELLGDAFVTPETPTGKHPLHEVSATQHEVEYVESIVQNLLYRVGLTICKRHCTVSLDC